MAALVDASGRSPAAVTRHIGLALICQRRATHSRVKVSRSPQAAAGTPNRVPCGRNPKAVNGIGTGDRTDGGDKRLHVTGRSLVIHML